MWREWIGRTTAKRRVARLILEREFSSVTAGSAAPPGVQTHGPGLFVSLGIDVIIASSSMDRKNEASQFITISGVFQFSVLVLPAEIRFHLHSPNVMYSLRVAQRRSSRWLFGRPVHT